MQRAGSNAGPFLHLAVRVWGYNPPVDATADARARTHDETLLEWFLSLDPDQRLAELESRLAFFNSVQGNDDAELSPDT
jgi:hypothetical protein